MRATEELIAPTVLRRRVQCILAFIAYEKSHIRADEVALSSVQRLERSTATVDDRRQDVPAHELLLQQALLDYKCARSQLRSPM